MQQESSRERGCCPRCDVALASEQVERNDTETEHDHLEDVEEVGSRAQPVRGYEQEVPRCRVVAEHLEAAHRVEAPEVREQPHGLVVDAHVEVDIPEPVVAPHHEYGERDHPGAQQAEERQRRGVDRREPLGDGDATGRGRRLRAGDGHRHAVRP